MIHFQQISIQQISNIGPIKDSRALAARRGARAHVASVAWGMEGEVKVRCTGAGEGVVVRQHAGMTRPDHFLREHSHTRTEPAHGLHEIS